MNRFFTLLFLALICNGLYSQHASAVKNTNNDRKPDSTSKAPAHSAVKDNHKGLMHNDLIDESGSLTSSDYIMSMERVSDKLNSIRDSSVLDFETEALRHRIDEMTGDITLIRTNIRGRNNTINIKNLYLYQSFATNLIKENLRIQKHITVSYERICNAESGLKNILSDTVFHKMYDDDSLRTVYEKRLKRIEKKWARTDSLTRSGIDTLNAIKVKVADNAMSLSAIKSMVEMRLDRSSRQIFSRETGFLWQPRWKNTSTDANPASVSGAMAGEKKAIGYYFSQTSGKRVLVLLLAVLFFTWMFIKRKLFRSLKTSGGSYGFLNLRYMNSLPVLSLIAALMCLMPFFDAYAPSSYIAIEFLILIAVASVIFYRKESKTFNFLWLMLLVLYAADTLTYIIAEPGFASRLWIIVTDTATIIMALFFLKKLDRNRSYYSLTKKAIATGVILTTLGIISNVLGRFSLSGILGMAGVFAITQSVVLPLFTDTFTEIVLIQLQSSRIKKGFNRPFDTSVVNRRIRVPLLIIAVGLWLIMLTSNLNIYQSLTNGLIDLLTTTRTIGSISFKLISIIWFFAIIWIAHILQKLISFIFGETGADADESTIVSKKQHSRLLITRLIVLVFGYLIAIAASGLPIDKLTIVIGALGVGIGMGLQNVVNNFVSGIILIFDGSLQIGDVIEFNGQAGKVKEIGLRASTLSTSDGAEVIIPNGNILSQNIVNWTFSNDQKRVMVWFTISGKELDSNVINEIINNTVAELPDVIHQKKPVILYNRASAENCTITVHFWSTIINADTAKSAAMLRLSAAFEAKNIKFE